MSSLNPVVGVSICIGALGAGLAYLAYNNKEEDTVSVSDENNTVSTETENESDKESTEPEPVNVKEEVTEEVTEEIKTKKQSHMKEFLKKSYDDIQDFN